MFFFVYRTESMSKKSEENQNSKKNSPSHDDGDDDNQVNKPLLDSVPKTEIKQPKKKVITIFLVLFCFV